MQGREEPRYVPLLSLYSAKIASCAHAPGTEAAQKSQALRKLLEQPQGRPLEMEEGEEAAWMSIDKNLVELLLTNAKQGLASLQAAFVAASKKAKDVCDGIDIKVLANMIYLLLYIYIYIYVNSIYIFM